MHVPLDEVANYPRFHEAAGAAFDIATNLLEGQGLAILANSYDGGHRVVKAAGLPTETLAEGTYIAPDSPLASLLANARQAGALLSETPITLGGLYAAGIAVAPIVLHDGRLFGAIIALPNADEGWNRKQRDILGNLATLIAFAVESELKCGRDRLTGLATRAVFDDRLAIEIARSRRSSTWLGVLVVGFEFPETSPSRSEAWWLIRISERLQSSVRSGDTVARVGPREVALLAPDLRDAVAAQRVATALIELLSDPLTACNEELVMTPSVGIALAPENGFNPRRLFDGAVQAMRHVHSRGGGTHELYSNLRLQRADQS